MQLVDQVAGILTSKKTKKKRYVPALTRGGRKPKGRYGGSHFNKRSPRPGSDISWGA
jgi:hypothetical protein